MAKMAFDGIGLLADSAEPAWDSLFLCPLPACVGALSLSLSLKINIFKNTSCTTIEV